jgi:hypothetical protein
MSNTPRTDALKPYLDKGFVEISTDSGTGSRILISESLGRAVKLNEDRAYHTFVEHAKDDSDEHLPQIFSHTVHEGDDQFSGYWFTVTEMEKLLALSNKEADGIIDWYKKVTAEDASTDAPDPFDLLRTFQALKDLAQNSRHNLDMCKSTNYMARERDGKRVVVITDPYN